MCTRILLLGLAWISLAVTADAAAIVGPGNAIANDHVRVAPLKAGDRCVGVRVTTFPGQKHITDLRLGPHGVITASKVFAHADATSAVLRLDGLSVDGGAVKFAPDSSVTVTVTADSAYPSVAFDLGLSAFDPITWQQLTGGTLPFCFLVCDLPDATMFYQGGGMIPMPSVDPFPFTATGFMAGEWAKGWSYAPPICAWAVPAVGLWNDRAATFVAYDFDEQRHTDRSGEFVASAGCTGSGAAPFFCLVHPYAKQFVKLTYPRVPSRVSSHFELIYSFDLPSAQDPNQFVLERLWRDKRALLPPVPRMNDLAWIPEYDGFNPSGGIEPTATGVNLIWTSGTTGLDGAFLEPGSRMIGNDFIADGILRARTLGKPDDLKILEQDLAYLMDHCTWVDIDGDRCATWIHPIEGKFRDMWGGERCSGNHHPSTFQIGAAMLLLYQTTGDKGLLPYIDGVYNWCRHYLFTRNGVCDLSWAMFSREATAVGENFLLNYRKVFQGDQVRGHHADEALAMARTAIYKNLWFYTADPDPSDDLDPTFLNQATNDCRWAGRVTWNEAGWVLRSMVPVYCETGDPFLKYLLRGSIERYYAGFRDDAGVAENLQILGEIEPKGLRTGGFPDPEHGDSVRRWARPLAPAKVRVAMGQKAAIAFDLGTRSYDVAEYRYAAPNSFSFRVVGLPGAPGEAIDLVATAPFRDLRGQPISVNGHPLAADRFEFNAATAGEDVFILGIKPGDVVSIGDASSAKPAPEDDLPYRAAPALARSPWQTIDLRTACDSALKMDWWQDGSWYGLAPGRREVWRIPVDLVDPETNGGRNAVLRGTVAIGKSATAVFAVFGKLHDTSAQTVGKLRLSLDGGEQRAVEVGADLPFDLTNGFPLRKFDTYLAVVDLGGPRTVQSLTVEGGTLLALTLAGAPSPDVAFALSQARETAYRSVAARTAQFYQAPVAQLRDDHPWAAGMTQPWCFRLTSLPAATDRTDAVLNVREDFAALLRQIGQTGTVEPSSLRAVEVTPGHEGAIPVQFDPLSAKVNQRGELLLAMPGPTPAGKSRSFDVYFGPDASPTKSPIAAQLTADRVTVSTGKGGVWFDFALGHPRLTSLAFAPEEQSNVLGMSGYNGGLADLTTCTDSVKWYDFGGAQTRPAHAEIFSAGPVATTVRVSGLEMWGQVAAPVGEAKWYFRFYAGKPVVEQWVDYRLDRLDSGWTRALQVRYALKHWDRTGTTGDASGSVGYADDLAVATLPGLPSTIQPQCMYTPDGNVLQVAFNQPDLPGEYFTGRWIAMPSRLADTFDTGPLTPVATEQTSVEVRAADRVVKRPPTPLALVSFDPTDGRGPTPTIPTREVVVAEGNLVPDPSFEQRGAFWALGTDATEARWTSSQVYSGKTAVDLSCTDKTLSIATLNVRGSHALGLVPNALYEVTFWAKCISGEGEVHVNFFGPEPGLDFPHILSAIPADNEWHHVRAEVPTGDFRVATDKTRVFTRTQAVAPSLRLWTYQKLQKTYVDQVEARRLR